MSQSSTFGAKSKNGISEIQRLTDCQTLAKATLRQNHNNAREIDNALEELKTKRVLMKFTKDIVRGPRNRLVDIAYTLQPDMDFINEMKKAVVF
jgi:hypothetical protein